MSESLAALHAPIDVGLGGVLLANMLAGWLDGDPKVLLPGEAADESQDHRTPPQQTGLCVCSSVDAGTSPRPSREHGAPVCPAGESTGTGLERAGDPVWPKISERVEHMRFSMMDAGDNGQQMDAPVGVRDRPGESRTPSAERISRGGEPYSESAPPAGIPADQWREDYAG